MDSDRINTIVKEIITHDPTLEEHSKELRMMISEIEDSRPDVHIDPAFMMGLRARLLLASRPTPSPFHSVAWWAVRLTPLGAVALFVLMVAHPSIRPTPTLPLPESPENFRTLDSQEGNDESAPSLRNGLRGEADTGIQTESTMMMKSAPFNQSEETVKIVFNPQNPGTFIHVDSITTQEPAFAVVFASYPRGEEVIGVSPIIAEGTTQNVPIYLKQNMVLEGSYYLTLYRDTGDRTFSISADIPFLDAFGNPLSLPVILLSE